MTETILHSIIALMVIVIILELVQFRHNASVKLPRIQKSFDAIDQAVRAEVAKHRDEAAAAARQSRDELNRMGAALTQSFDQLRQTVEQRLQRVQDETVAQLTQARQDSLTSANELRVEVAKQLQGVQETQAKSLGETSQLQKGQLDKFAAQLDKLATVTDEKLAGLTTTVAAQLQAVQTENVKQLELLRVDVTEKVQATEQRLDESVRQVSARVKPA